MHFIEHIIEPTKLLLAWQSSGDRRRYIVGELHRDGEAITLTYLTKTPDFQKAKEQGFEFYPAFRELDKVHQNVIDAFMRRLPPRKRGDFPEYLEGLRISREAQLSDFALLGYSGAKLRSDDFSLIHPFNDVESRCELMLEVAGLSHHISDLGELKIGASVSFFKEKCNAVTQEKAIEIIVDGRRIGYVNRGLMPTFWSWIESNRLVGAWIEKLNGSPSRPAVYVYVEVAKHSV